MKMQKPNPEIWIDADIELPFKDGYYYVTNHPKDTYDLGCCYYDGFGFVCDRIYRNVKYWAEQKPLEKKYGKQ